MRIQSVSTNHYKKTLPSKTKPTFQAKKLVNAKYYEEAIIEKAKKALKNPRWEDQLREKLISTAEALTSWHHHNDMEGMTGLRIFTAIVTFGVSEAYYGYESLEDAYNNNKAIEEDISEIKSCMEDLIASEKR